MVVISLSDKFGCGFITPLPQFPVPPSLTFSANNSMVALSFGYFAAMFLKEGPTLSLSVS